MSSATELASDLRPPLTGEQALIEADRCLECGDAYAPAPCLVACPAEIDVPGFVGALAAADPELAAQTIFAENLLGATCARVCPVEVLCEGACVPSARDSGPSRSRASSASQPIGRLPASSSRGKGGRARVVASPSSARGPPRPGVGRELAATDHDVTVFDERAEVGAVSPALRSPHTGSSARPLRRKPRCSSDSASSSDSAGRSTRRARWGTWKRNTTRSC